MSNNTILSNMTHTYRGCNIDFETIDTVILYTFIVTSICSFLGNLLVILTVYKNKNLQTSNNYFIVSMSVSDILFPLLELLHFMLLLGRFPQLSKLVGILLCKLFRFISDLSYEVSMLTLVAITVYRFFAVMFPMRARVQNKRKRLLVLLLTWVIPMAMSSPYLVFLEFNENNPFCVLFSITMRQYLYAVFPLLFFFISLLTMLVLYPLIIIKLMKKKVPGNVHCDQVVIRRRRQNLRLTMMFLVITVAFLLSWGPNVIFRVSFVTEQSWLVAGCNSYFYLVSLITPFVFHAINPVIYFIFLSSFRQGFKNIFRSSCCSRTRPQAPADNFELNNIPQALHNN